MDSARWDRVVASTRSRVWLLVLVIAAVVVVGVVGGAVGYVKFFRAEPPPYFASDEEHFLFGSIGTEAEQGVPYWIWLVLPRLFPEHLPRPGGYAALGILGKDGHEMPVGLSKVTIGYPRVGINCALCHTARWRDRALAPPTLVSGGPAHQSGAQEYFRFLSACAADPRFTASIILGEIAKNHRLSLLDRLLYRFVIIPSTRRRLQRLEHDTGWMANRPEWGRGRADMINLAKFSFLRQPADNTIGSADLPPLWSLGPHERTALGWDGSNSDLNEIVVSSALSTGASRTWVDGDMREWDSTDPDNLSSLRRIQNYIGEMKAARYPFAVDQPLAQRGKAIFDNECAACHALGGARTGKVIAVQEVGTDRHRLDSWTADAASAYNAYGEGHDWKFAGFTKTAGYVSVPLDGVWLRAPYLHNGSVPTLADLLEPPDVRPKRFWPGYDVYDPAKVGFVSEGAEAERIGTLHDTAEPGNGNAGHLYGIGLPPQIKRALLEYLKTQ
jgi:mono/diheme cytochrome c family protein